MRIGLFTLSTDQGLPFSAIALEAERRGFDVIFTGEHSHIPVHAPNWSGGQLPRHYRHILDPFVALASAASQTSKIKLGTAVCLLALHDPLHFSKLATSVDHISAGRLILGLGYGYLEQEIENHGIDFKDRKNIFRDKMRAIQTLWTQEVANYRGSYVAFSDVEQYPKPFNGKQPTVLLGAKLRGETIRDMIEFCDGWLPTAMMGGDHLAGDIARLKTEWAAAGRDCSAMEMTVFHTATSGEGRRADDWGAESLTQQIIDAYEEAGTKTLCVPLPPRADHDTIMRYFDDYSAKFAPYLDV